ncbi:hypothetical protein VQ7734_00253 [Vibrio quintilis]|uniref:Uncharacterized protein n=1 Tax=Vibrio quintilis TaxID=1117707 RepID=A0A1M7YPK6_9VIBR|nr:hypothetical protein [Vibrio quintilis]SHO54539.1 hypothetical protein VQ7734_00253 [Vibrio quintilis]
MVKAYCPVCQKITPHKSIMRRSPSDHCSRLQVIQSFISSLMQGNHYYKLERQCFCRVCNHQNIPSALSFTEPRIS